MDKLPVVVVASVLSWLTSYDYCSFGISSRTNERLARHPQCCIDGDLFVWGKENKERVEALVRFQSRVHRLSVPFPFNKEFVPVNPFPSTLQYVRILHWKYLHIPSW